MGFIKRNGLFFKYNFLKEQQKTEEDAAAVFQSIMVVSVKIRREQGEHVWQICLPRTTIFFFSFPLRG